MDITMRFIKISVSLLFVCFLSEASEKKILSEVAVVSELKGECFQYSQGKLTPLSPGDHIIEGSDVLVEMGGHLLATDYNDRVYNLSGSSTTQFKEDSIVLKKGFLWIQLNKAIPTKLYTTNSLVEFKEGEGILSYDPVRDQTQYVSIDGRAVLSNSAIKEFKTFVNPGGFSLVNPEEDKGRPRYETAIGKSSYKKLRNLFSHVKPIREPVAMKKIAVRKIKIKREIASVSPEKSLDSAELEDKNLQKAALENSLKKYRKKKIVYRFPKVKFNLFTKMPERKKKVKRTPASEVKQKPSLFKKDLFKAYKKQKKYDAASRKLIKELKSFRMDYFDSY